MKDTLTIIGYNMLSRQSLDILIDLVEIKLSAIIILDKDDVREVQKLKNCKNELLDSMRTAYAKKDRHNSNREIAGAV